MRLAATRSWIRLWGGAESLWSAGVCAAAGQRRSNNAACAASPTDRFMFTSSNLVAFPRFGHLYATAQMPPIRTLSSAARWCVICGRSTNGAHDQPGSIWSGGSHVTKREGAANRRGFLANGLSLAGAPVNLSILCDSPGRTPHHSHSIIACTHNKLTLLEENLTA